MPHSPRVKPCICFPAMRKLGSGVLWTASIWNLRSLRVLTALYGRSRFKPGLTSIDYSGTVSIGQRKQTWVPSSANVRTEFLSTNNMAQSFRGVYCLRDGR